MTAEKISRKERDRKMREDDFLDAAEKLFAAKGYHQTSMEDVAKDAEYATGTIYRYFPSKEELYNAVLIKKGKAFFSMIDTAMKDCKDPVEKLKAILKGKVHFFFSNASFVKIYLSQVSGSSNTITPPAGLRESHAGYMKMIGNIFKDGMKKGLFLEMDVDMLVLSFMGITNHLLFTAVSEDKNLSEKDIESFIMNFLSNGLIKKGK